jgi:hypothetical protein
MKNLVKDHREKVAANMSVVAELIQRRGDVHDITKLMSPEVELARAADKCLGPRKGLENRRGKCSHVDAFIAAHYCNPLNSHHPEHFENGVEDMNMIDMLEMLCDWRACCSGNFSDTLDRGFARFKVSGPLRSLMRKTCKELGWL